MTWRRIQGQAVILDERLEEQVAPLPQRMCLKRCDVDCRIQDCLSKHLYAFVVNRGLVAEK